METWHRVQGEVSWTLTKKLDTFAGPGEIKSREVMLDPQVSPEEIKSREVELGLKAGLLLLQLFPNGGAADIDFVTIPHSSCDSSCKVQYLLSQIGHLASMDIKQNYSVIHFMCLSLF